MSKDFEIGDRVIYYRKPEEAEWKDIGKIDIELPLGCNCEICYVSRYSLKYVQVRYNGRVYGYYPVGMFKLVDESDYIVPAGSYIVVLNVAPIRTSCAKNNYCFKQGESKEYMCPACDLQGDSNNNNTTLSFNRKENLLDWRYATEEEIKEYLRIGKPYDVTMKTSSYLFKIGDMVEVVKNGSGVGLEHIGKLVTITELGIYEGEQGYKVSPPIGNTLTGKYNGFIGESSFKLVRKLNTLLVDEAKEKYPIGTKFFPAHMTHDPDVLEYCIITNTIFETRGDEVIRSLTDEGDHYSSPIEDPKYGNVSYNRNVYFEGKWAKIITEEDISSFLLQKAKKDYTIGTSFYSAHSGCKFTIRNTPNFYIDRDGDVLDVETGVVFKVSKNKWAEIITEEPKKEESPKIDPTSERFTTNSELKMGDWVQIVNLTASNGCKLNGEIGHVGRINRIDRGWYGLDPYCIGGSWEARNLKKIPDPTKPHSMSYFEEVPIHSSVQKLTETLGKIYHDASSPMSWKLDVEPSSTPTIKQIIIPVKKI